MTFEYTAFLSYSHGDGEWVEILQQNLEASLQALEGGDPKVFLDTKDLTAGRSWVRGRVESGDLTLYA